MQKVPDRNTENAQCDQYKVGLLEDLGADPKNQLIVVLSYQKLGTLFFM
jgi:hypothetical protein